MEDILLFLEQQHETLDQVLEKISTELSRGADVREFDFHELAREIRELLALEESSVYELVQDDPELSGLVRRVLFDHAEIAAGLDGLCAHPTREALKQVNGLVGTHLQFEGAAVFSAIWERRGELSAMHDRFDADTWWRSLRH